MCVVSSTLCAGTARSLFQGTGPPRRTESKRAVSHGSGLFAARSALISAVKVPITRASNETTAIPLSDFTRIRWVNAHVGALRGVEWRRWPIAKMLCAEVVHCLLFNSQCKFYRSPFDLFESVGSGGRRSDPIGNVVHNYCGVLYSQFSEAKRRTYPLRRT